MSRKFVTNIRKRAVCNASLTSNDRYWIFFLMWFNGTTLLFHSAFNLSLKHRWISYLKRGESFKHSSKSSLTVISPFSCWSHKNTTLYFSGSSRGWRRTAETKSSRVLTLQTGSSTHYHNYHLYSSRRSRCLLVSSLKMDTVRLIWTSFACRSQKTTWHLLWMNAVGSYSCVITSLTSK